MFSFTVGGEAEMAFIELIKAFSSDMDGESVGYTILIKLWRLRLAIYVGRRQ